MTNSTLRSGFLVTIALAAAGAVAQQSDQAPDGKNEAAKVQQTMVRLSDAGTPIEHFWVDRKVSFADLDLTTTTGSDEFVRRVTEAARQACAQVHTADPVDLSDMDNDACIREATGAAVKQAQAVAAAKIGAATTLSTDATRPRTPGQKR